MLARDPVTGYFHDVPDQLLQGYLVPDDLADGLGLPIAPLLASVVPSLLGGLFGGGGGARGGAAPPAGPAPMLVPQMIPIPIPIPIPVPMPARQWANWFGGGPPIAPQLAASYPARSFTRRRRR